MLKPNTHYIILSLFIFILLFGNIRGQEYDVTLWGISIGNAKLQQNTEGEINLTIVSSEYLNYVFPINFEYYSKFDKANYKIIELNKKVEQGKEIFKYRAALNNDNILVYNDRESIELEPNTFSLLSFFIKVMNSQLDEIDTKWFNLENEGILYKTRLLLNDSTKVSINNEDISCDHYRLDLKIINDETKMFEKTDHFNDLFFDINSVRQIWIEKWQKKPRIIKIAIKNSLVSLNLVIKN